MIAHLTADLMMASTAKATATANGLEYRSFPNLNAMEQALPDDTIHLLLVDLQLANLDLAQLTDIVKQHFSDEQHRCVAYAQPCPGRPFGTSTRMWLSRHHDAGTNQQRDGQPLFNPLTHHPSQPIFHPRSSTQSRSPAYSQSASERSELPVLRLFPERTGWPGKPDTSRQSLVISNDRCR